MHRQFALTIGIIGAVFGLAFSSIPPGMAVAREVGVTSAANPTVQGTPPEAEKRTLYIGTDVFFNERIQTSDKGIAQILLMDQSAFTVGHNSEIVVDEFVYDPGTETGRLVTSMSKGVLRFVGGKLSKQDAGVTIKTPLVVIGVRGGIVTVAVDPETGLTTVKKDYGDQVTITGANGEKVTIIDNGYESTAEPDGTMSDPAPVTEEGLILTEDALTGETGTTGGTADQPTNDYVATTEIVQLGSGSEPDDPVTATVGLSTSSGDPAPGETDPTQVSEETSGVNEGSGDQLQQQIPTILETPPPLLSGAGRYLAAGDSFTLAWGPVIANPGSVDLLGGSPDTDQSVTSMELLGDRLLLTLSGGDTVDLPYQIGSFAVTDAGTPGGAASGVGFVSDTEDFYYYQLTLDSDPDGHIILFGGSPLIPSPDGVLNLYTIHPDAVQGLDVPFMSSDLLPDTTGMVTTPFYILETTAGTNEVTVALYGALQIEGQGADQKSAVALFVSDIWLNPDTGMVEIDTARRGSVRRSATGGAITFAGSIDGLADGSGNVFFGDEGYYFVLGTEPADQDAYSDHYSGGDAPGGGSNFQFGTQHLVSYDSTIDRSTLQRTNQTFYMYSAGIAEHAWWMTEAPTLFRTSNGDPSGSALNFDPSRNRLSAMLQLEDTLGTSAIEEYQLGFGRFPEGYGASAYIDDETYAALYNRYVTKVFADGGTEMSFFGSNPFTYFFTNTLVPVDGFLPAGVTFCTCAFMEWGYWGGRLNYEDPNAVNPGDTRQDYFHLETWVAGDLPDLIDIPNSGVATYSGHAIGDVYRDLGVSVQQYIAVGNFDMSWDFSARLGTATISDFDGMTFGSAVDGIASANWREFTGAIGNVDVAGELQGSFFASGTDPVAGVGGDFYVTGVGYAAAGTFAGEQTSFGGGLPGGGGVSN